jgi:CBS domain-containing protein
MTVDDPRAGMALTESAGQPTVGDVMRPPTTTVERQAHLAAAAYLMKRSGDTALVVISDEGDDRRPVAIITDADISQAVADGKDLEDTRISNLSARTPVTLEREAGVGEAIDLMLSMGIAHVPVVDAGRLVGIVDMADVCRALLGPDGTAPRR